MSFNFMLCQGASLSLWSASTKTEKTLLLSALPTGRSVTRCSAATRAFKSHTGNMTVSMGDLNNTSTSIASFIWSEYP